MSKYCIKNFPIETWTFTDSFGKTYETLSNYDANDLEAALYIVDNFVSNLEKEISLEQIEKEFVYDRINLISYNSNFYFEPLKFEDNCLLIKVSDPYGYEILNYKYNLVERSCVLQ